MKWGGRGVGGLVGEGAGWEGKEYEIKGVWRFFRDGKEILFALFSPPNARKKTSSHTNKESQLSRNFPCLAPYGALLRPSKPNSQCPI